MNPIPLPRTFAAVAAYGALTLAAPAYEPPTPGIALEAGSATISWQGSGTLYSSSSLESDWTEEAGALSPHVTDTTGFDRLFYRVAYETFNYVAVDTNQTTYYDNNGNAMTPPPTAGEALFGQDAEYRVSPPNYTDNGDGTVTDNNTGLMWQQVPPAAFYTRTAAQTYADSLVLGGHGDWRLPTLKELFSLADFTGSSRREIDLPYIDPNYFTIHDPQAIDPSKRDIDGQFWSSTDYVGRTINNDSSTFGFNFLDGRIKSYPNGIFSGPTSTQFVRCVRGSASYGQNNFIDNGDGTITDLSTGLMWLKDDSGADPTAGTRGDGTLDWQQAIDWAENLTHAGYDDWVLPDPKQLHTIVDYTRAPDHWTDPTLQTAAIDPIFNVTEEESWFWTSSSLGDDLFRWGVYICFGRSLAHDSGTGDPTVNAHGAGALRSDPKDDDGTDYSGGHGPQLDQVRIYNYARPVRHAIDPPALPPAPALFTAAFPTVPALPDRSQVTSITVGGVVATIVSYDSATGLVGLFLDDDSLAPGRYDAILNHSPGGTPTQVVSTNQHVVSAPPNHNVLLLIVDDWGVDASPVDNTEPGVQLPNMPHLETLAASGLRFTRAFVNPACSPTRASLMTGRYAHQTGVYTPANASAFSTAETTLPEAMTAAGSPYAVASVGKWHLGGNNSGYSFRGGWPEFYGINGSGVADYYSWEKNTNGTVAITTTYSTTDQVDETIAFIDRSETAGEPWFCWVAFNSPHTPLQEPPASLEPANGGGYTNEGLTDDLSVYIRMLESLDTEIGRLLDEVDPNNTNIIVIGDNGTPGSTIQAPYGNGHAKGVLYNGGIHVPLVATGPAVKVPAGSTTDKLVHAVDIYSTILELANIDPSTVAPADAVAQSTSIVPVLHGTDINDRCMIAEGGEGTGRGRAILLDDYPDYKLIIFGDPESTLDTPVFEFYNIGVPANDMNEQDNLIEAGDPPLTGTALAAYNACLAKDQALGGGFSDPSSSYNTLYIELPASGVTPPVPSLTRPNGNPLAVTSVTVNGGAVTPVTVVGRDGWGSTLSDETDDTEDRYWVKVRVPYDAGASYTTAHVVFPSLPPDLGGDAREYDSVNILVNPNP